MIDIADLCEAISSGQVRAYPSPVPGYRRRATRRPERQATATDHKSRWQKARRAQKRAEREAINGPTRFGPKPGGAT